MFSFFRPLTQTGALPFVETAAGFDVALVTTRRRKRWVVPKGWPMKGMTLAEAAARETVEEAGVVGDVADEPIGSYRYRKFAKAGYRLRCEVLVFPLRATTQQLDWKEKPKRRLCWTPLADAADMIEEPGLAQLIDDIAATPERLTARFKASAKEE